MYSIICGVLGLLLGGAIGGQAGNFAIGLFGVIGFLSPVLYVLDQIYKSNKSSNEIDFDLTSTLDTLKENDILNDNEYIKSLNYFNLVDKRNENKRNENKKKFDECGKIFTIYIITLSIIFYNIYKWKYSSNFCSSPK